jgi:hypothetical protein
MISYNKTSLINISPKIHQKWTWMNEVGMQRNIQIWFLLTTWFRIELMKNMEQSGQEEYGAKVLLQNLC